MNCLCVPSLGLDVSLLDRLATSIDVPIRWKCVLNNGPLGALEDFACRNPEWFIKEPGNNLGVAGSWNQFAKWFSSEPCWLIANEDCFFLPGQLEQICACMDANPDAPITHVNDSHAYYCFGWSLAGREQFGEFDENFFVYYEDCDMRVRHRLAGVRSYPYALQGQTPVPHGKPQSGGANYSAFIQGVGLFGRAYWRRKWGSLNFEDATYQNPYRDHRLKPSEWVWDAQLRSEIWPLWRTFIEQPHPNIYE